MTALARRTLDWLAVFLWPAGRIGRGAFALAAPLVYAAWYAAPFAMNGLIAYLEGPEAGADMPFWAIFAFYPALAGLAYVSLCVHQKRLADAGRGVWSFWLLAAGGIALLMALPAIIVATTPVALSPTSPREPSRMVEPLSFLMAVGPMLAILIAWPLYSLWVGLAPSRPAPLEEPAAPGLAA